MKNKKVITIVLAAMLACTALAGCGKKEATDEFAKTVDVETDIASETTDNKTDNDEASSEETVKTLSEALSENDYSIWFCMSDMDTWNLSPRIFIFYKDGTYSECWSNGKRFGDYEMMTDEEIVSLAEENALKRGEYFLSVFTDKYSTDDKVTREIIYADNLYIELNNGYVPTQQVVDSYYGGFKEDSHVFITRTSQNTSFVFDAVGTNDIEVNEMTHKPNTGTVEIPTDTEVDTE